MTCKQIEIERRQAKVYRYLKKNFKLKLFEKISKIFNRLFKPFFSIFKQKISSEY